MDLSLFQQGGNGQHGRSVAVGRGNASSALTPSSVSNTSIASPGSVSGSLRLPGIGPGGLGGLDYRGIVSHDADSMLPETHASGPSRKKQKRNKPTLSCHECVERKTKVRTVRAAGLGQPLTRDNCSHPFPFSRPYQVPSTRLVVFLFAVASCAGYPVH